MDATEAQTYAARSTVDGNGIGVAPVGGPVEAGEEERGKEAEALKAQVDGCGEAGTSASAEAASRRVRLPGSATMARDWILRLGQSRPGPMNHERGKSGVHPHELEAPRGWWA